MEHPRRLFAQKNNLETVSESAFCYRYYGKRQLSAEGKPMPLPIPRRYSKVEIPIHFVWGTLERRPILIPSVERVAHRVIQSKAQQLEATVLALNGTPDHIHLAVLFSPNVAVASFVRQIKRAATVAIREQYGDQLFFAWEPGYAAFAFPFGKRQVVMEYIRNQKAHHGNEKTIAYWEEIGEWRGGDVPSPSENAWFVALDYQQRRGRLRRRNKMTEFETTRLPTDAAATAPDGTAVRPLLSLGGGSFAHFELAPGQTSAAVAHRTVEEIWYFLGGMGEMWRKQGEREEFVAVEAGVCLTIPLGTSFQFRCFGSEPLVFVAVTMPPWPGADEAYEAAGAWKPTIQAFTSQDLH